jgi:hypothetical protein
VDVHDNKLDTVVSATSSPPTGYIWAKFKNRATGIESYQYTGELPPGVYREFDAVGDPIYKNASDNIVHLTGETYRNPIKREGEYPLPNGWKSVPSTSSPGFNKYFKEGTTKIEYSAPGILPENISLFVKPGNILYIQRKNLLHTTYNNLDTVLKGPVGWRHPSLNTNLGQSLVNAAQAVPYGNIGVVVPTNTSGVTVNQIYYNYELKTYYSAMSDLAKATNGFDFNIKVAYDGGGNPTKTLQLGYPRLGNTYSSTSTTVPVFQLPAGNIVQYNYKEDGAKAANTVYLTGAGSNEGKLIATGTDSTKTAAGWALLEDSVNYSNITDSTLLGNMATGQVSVVSYPPQTLQIVAPPYVDPVYGSYSLGDQARVIVKDDFYPTTFDGNYRIIGLNVSPGENNQPERVTLTLTTTSN